MEFIPTKIKGLTLIKPQVFGDNRGYFLEAYNTEKFKQHIGDVDFIQVNESKSSYGVLRGLHFQKPPYTQAKLVRCIEGKVLDVAVDLRQDSPTFGQHQSFELSGDNKHQLFVPRGFAHGFVVLSEFAIFSYMVDNQYAPDCDSGIAWNDKSLNIDWQLPVEDIILSEKDKKLLALNQTDNPF
ncbi:dTDP-4-dehydrorhamnose 3,5-epimerase [Carboxylicivirga marina]|uniref:dTDP-4-dehydrorhamnose 3,5-epimerase n=1 Tax=Carboxylicivirga marina TaxID=2800988 RepID=UPI0025995341|nr:dTDP-4-dehydrorhamnose 3,5-epimerase [uncultured Carboxylicivirga sp.]